MFVCYARKYIYALFNIFDLSLITLTTQKLRLCNSANTFRMGNTNIGP